MKYLVRVGTPLVALSMLGTGCKSTSDSNLQSLLGLEAGQDDKIRQAKASTFITLSDWFQSFRVSTNGADGTVATANLSGRVPADIVNIIRAYLRDQSKRHDAFEAALQKRDDAQITKLLDLETREMKDIALALISDSPDWNPPTGDKLAKVIVASRRHSNFADTFATKGFLDIVFATSTTYGLVNNLEAERKTYLAALLDRYVGDAARRAVLQTRIDQDRTVISEMLASLDKSTRGAALNLTEGKQYFIQGNVAALTIFLKNGSSDADRRTLASEDAASLNESGDATEDGNSGKSDVDILRKNAYSTVDSPNASYVPYFKMAPPDLSLALPDTNLSSSSTNASNTGESSTSSSDKSTIRAAFIDKNDHDYVTNAGNAAGAVRSTAQSPAAYIAKPTLDCSTMGLGGEALINCQRYLAYAQPVRDPNERDLDSGISTTNNLSKMSVANNTALIKAYILEGSIDDDSGDVANQGSLGSCTQHGVHSVLRLSLRRLGVDPNRVLARTGREINNIFLTTQQSYPFMGPAITAAKSVYGDTLNIKGRRIKTWAEAKEIMVTTGRPIFFAVTIGQIWMTDGGGDEFRLMNLNNTNGALSLAETVTPLPCPVGVEANHAVAIVGFIGDNPIIKNSWGVSWKRGGLALLDYKTCAGPNADKLFYDVEVSVK